MITSSVSGQKAYRALNCRRLSRKRRRKCGQSHLSISSNRRILKLVVETFEHYPKNQNSITVRKVVKPVVINSSVSDKNDNIHKQRSTKNPIDIDTQKKFMIKQMFSGKKSKVKKEHLLMPKNQRKSGNMYNKQVPFMSFVAQMTD